MSSNENNHIITPQNGYDSVESLEEALFTNLPEDDPRLNSGVNKEIVEDDLAFIEMSGITQVQPPQESPAKTHPDEFSAELTALSEAELQKISTGDESKITDSELPQVSSDSTPTATVGISTSEFISSSSNIPHRESVRLSEQFDKLSAVVDLPVVEEQETFSHEEKQSEVTSEKKPENASQLEEIIVDTKPISAEVMSDEDWAPISTPSRLEEAEELVNELEAHVETLKQEEEVRQSQGEKSSTTVDTKSSENKPEQKSAIPVFSGIPQSSAKPAPIPENQVVPKTSKSRGSRRSKRYRKKFALLSFAIIFLLCSIFFGSYLVQWFTRITATPDALLNLAQRYAQKGSYVRAISTYEEFLSKFPEHPERGNVQFTVAFFKQMLASRATDAPSNSMLDQAIQELEKFLQENPSHPKIARAQTLLGTLYYRRGEYHKCIELLSPPELRLQDPGASLSILRTLARAYANVGDIKNAQTTFLTAASLEENPSPDRDYEELSNIYMKMAESAQTVQEHLRHQQMALLYLERASSYPGVSPTIRNSLLNKISVLRTKIKQTEENKSQISTPYENSESEEKSSGSSFGTAENEFTSSFPQEHPEDQKMSRENIQEINP